METRIHIRQQFHHLPKLPKGGPAEGFLKERPPRACFPRPGDNLTTARPGDSGEENMTHLWQPFTGQGSAKRLQGLMRGMDRWQTQPTVEGLLGGQA